MKREQILTDAIQLTTKSRPKEYGSPRDNYLCLGELIDILNRFTHAPQTCLQRGVKAALTMVLVKIIRAWGGHKAKADNFIDGAAYFAIAGEIALPDEEEEKSMHEQLKDRGLDHG